MAHGTMMGTIVLKVVQFCYPNQTYFLNVVKYEYLLVGPCDRVPTFHGHKGQSIYRHYTQCKDDALRVEKAAK